MIARRAALGAALGLAGPCIALSPAAAQSGNDARAAAALAPILQQVRAIAAAEGPAAALRFLDVWATRNARRLATPDRLELQTEAARLTLGASGPDAARSRLVAAHDLLARTDREAPPVRAGRLRRSMAELHACLGEPNAVAPLLEASLRSLAPVSPVEAAEVANGLGIARLELMLVKEAMESFGQGLRLLPDTGETTRVQAVSLRVNLALAQLETRSLGQARRTLDEAEAVAAGDTRLQPAIAYARAQLLLCQPDLDTAEAILLRLVAPGMADALRGHALLLLATSRFNRGRSADAVEAAFGALEAYRAVLACGEHHPAFGRVLHTLGAIHVELGDRETAAECLAHAATLHKAAFGARSVQYQATIIEQAALDILAAARMPEAQRGALALEVERSVMAARQVVDAAPQGTRRLAALARVVLGLTYEMQARPDAAAEMFREAQDILRWVRGAEPDRGFSLLRLARLLTRDRQFDEAERVLEEAVALYRQIGAEGTVRHADVLTAIAEMRAAMRRDRAGQSPDEREATEALRDQALAETCRAFDMVRTRLPAADPAAVSLGEAHRRGARELLAVQAGLLLELAPDDPAMVEQAFRASQESLASGAGEALRQIALRLAATDDGLAALLRRREELAERLRQIHVLLLRSAAPSDPAGARDAGRLREDRDATVNALLEAETDLRTRYPEQAATLYPAPAALADARAALEADEALLVPVLGAEQSILWVVTPAETRFRLLKDLRRAEVEAQVRLVRAEIDRALCAHDTGARVTPNFDGAALRRLHAQIIAPAEATRLLGPPVVHLFFVAEGPLARLPPHLMRDARNEWLVRRYAVTVSPSVEAALATRRLREASSHAPDAFLGIADARFAVAPRTLAAVRLPEVPRAAAQPAAMCLPGAAAQGVPRGGWTTGGPNLEALAQLPVLDHSGTQVRAMAERFEAGSDSLLLGPNATSGRFVAAKPGRFRVIAFATHALMAGKYGLREPSIVLSPEEPGRPASALLAASEIAVMRLDADLVVLSACNTASPDSGPYAEGLSALARAFLQAGTRSLLVSHWNVADRATELLMTEFAEAARKARMAGRPARHADLLREAMLGRMKNGDITGSNPIYWAPFVVVGA